MKKIFSIAMMFIAINSFAKGSSYTQFTPENYNGNLIRYDASFRIKIFDSNRNSLTSAGEVLVCLPQFENNWDGSCLDSKKQNAWYRVEDSSPASYQVTYIEYRFIGSGSRILIVHYAPK